MKGISLNIEESVRLEAYLLSEKAGHPYGMETMFWAQAEAIVQSRTAVIAPSGRLKVARAPVGKKEPLKREVAAVKTSPRRQPDTQLLLAPELPAEKRAAKKTASLKAAKLEPETSVAKTAKVPAKRTRKK